MKGFKGIKEKAAAFAARHAGIIKTALGIKSALFTAFVAALVFISAPQAHKKYLVGTLGEDIIMLLKPSNHGGGGTGFVVKAPSGKLYTITNAHVCGVAENGYMDGMDPAVGRSVRLRVLEVSKTTDLCILDAMPHRSGAKLARGLNVGDEVAVIGHPLLEALTFARGDVRSFEEITLNLGFNIPEEACDAQGGTMVDVNRPPYSFFGVKTACTKRMASASTTAVVYPGNSGSPVVNIFGNVVGVLFASNSETNYGYIVPLSQLREFLAIY